ncbi:MAG: hypothetical protein GXP63_04920, partial [DPANN group archaeon]|nr:hypothetical protein [DPANN group archaeon]
GINDGFHQWNVTCQDNASNSHTSTTRNFTVNAPPTIVLDQPPTNYWNNTGNITFLYTPTDTGGLANCSLYVDDQLNQTNTTALISGSQQNFSLSGLAPGIYNWTVQCIDLGGLSSAAAPRIFRVDRTGPNITLLTPEANASMDSSSITFNFTASDDMGTPLLCNITLNGSVTNPSTLVVQNGTNASSTTTGLTDGLFFWNVTCLDNASNSGTSPTRNFTLNEPPRVALLSPGDGTESKEQNQTFVYVPRDNSGSIADCSLILNDVVNRTNTSISASQSNNFTVYGLPDNVYNWTVNCTDGSGNRGTNVSGRLLYIDNEGPAIDLHHPSPSQAMNSNTVLFNWTASDNVLSAMTCNLTIDDQVNVSGIAGSSGIVISQTVANFSQGTHNWSVACWDSLNNSNTSLTRSFVINIPDLFVNASFITFNTTSPTEGQSILINATIMNIGGTAADFFAVRFYDGRPSSGGSLIGAEINVTNLGADENITVNVTWTAKLDLHTIWVFADYHNNVTETSEDNNNASRNITISAWHFIVGNNSGDLEIHDTDANVAFAWTISNATGTNIYAVDSDGSVSWSALRALGQNSSNATRMDDFTQLDDALNMENFTQNVNTTFTAQGSPRKTGSFIIFGKNQTQVPLANSTNTSSFMTGILWDTSDGGDGNFDGTEDVVFITENKGVKTGAYGNYEFEIRVPALLRQYIAPNNENSITLYLELK